MRSGVLDTMPAKVRRGLRKLGADIAVARRKRRLTVAMMLERTSLSKQTYQRIEKGDPAASIGAYAMCLFALGFNDPFGDIADMRDDDTGLLLDKERLPKRVRVPKGDGAL